MKKLIFSFVLLAFSHAISAQIITAISPINIGCFGGTYGSVNLTVTGGTSPYLYTWSNGDTTQNILNLIAGTYCVTVTDANSNSASNCATVTQPSSPVSITLTTTNVLCNGDSTGSITPTITGGTPGLGGYTYLWSDAWLFQGQVVPAGTYCITTADGFGCSASACATITQPPPLRDSTVRTNASCPTCADGSASVGVYGGTPNYTCVFSSPPLGSGTFYSGLLPGVYHFYITDVNNCTLYDSVVISTGNCSANFSLYPDSLVQHHYFVVNMASGVQPLTYLWDWGDSTNDTTPFPSHTYSAAGFYPICLTITDATGCTDFYCHSFQLINGTNEMLSVDVIPQTNMGIKVVDDSMLFSLFPNPATNNLQLNLPQKAELTILNLQGQEIKTLAAAGATNINISALASGMYFIKVKTENAVGVKKFIKE